MVTGLAGNQTSGGMKRNRFLRFIILLLLGGTLAACSPVKAVIKAPVKIADAVVETIL